MYWFSHMRGFMPASAHVGHVWTKQHWDRLSPSVSFHHGSPYSYNTWEWTIGLLVATVQRCSLTPSTWRWTNFAVSSSVLDSPQLNRMREADQFHVQIITLHSSISSCVLCFQGLCTALPYAGFVSSQFSSWSSHLSYPQFTIQN
jgi:hypothetical protein